MICANCGKQFHDRRIHKYCPKCAPIVQRKKQEQWRLKHKHLLTPAPRYCKRCGAEVPPRRHYCDACKAEHERTYQREYKRRIRAKK